MMGEFEGLRRALQSWGLEPSSEEARAGKMVAQEPPESSRAGRR